MTDSRPNILLVITDQQSATMMSCTGNPHLRTPAMDSLAATGVRFERAYCTNPVCVPSRFSLMTGRYPTEIGMRNNISREINVMPEHILQRGMGWVLRDAGYETVYGGKVHLPKQTTPEQIGFDVISEDERDQLAEDCAAYLKQPHDKPFLLVASFINPHDICHMAIRDSQQTDHEKLLIRKCTTECATLDEALKSPEGMSEDEFYATVCPPVPPNFEVPEDEPAAIQKLWEKSPFKAKARREWPVERWRLHRWAYARLTEFVDAQIGRVLDALREAGLEKDTVVVFTSDHGDNDAARRMEHKSVLYDQAARIPLLVSQPGTTPAGLVDDTHVVSNGLDLLPTLCDYAGVAPPDDLKGSSLRSLAEGREPEQWRSSLKIESEISFGVVTDQYKYIRHDEGANPEQLFDLARDPFEIANLVRDPALASALAAHRETLDREVSGHSVRRRKHEEENQTR